MTPFLRPLICCFLLWTQIAVADELCPIPELQNVSYTSVTELPSRQPDQVFSYGEDELQRAEVWHMAAHFGAGLAPVVVLVHGGCWLNAYDIAHTRPLSTALADAGYNVWSLEYRRTGDSGGGWPGTFDDILMGLNALTQQAPPGFDLSRIAVLGHSAGGHLVMLAAGSPRLTVSPRVIIGLAPITNLESYAAGQNSCQQATSQFMGGSVEQYPAQYQQASVQPDSDAEIEVFALHGALDEIVPLSQTQGFRRRVVEGAGHFDFVHPHTPAFQAILQELAKHL